MDSKFCPNCGNPVSENACFCGACGCAIKPPQETVVESVAQAPVAQEPVQQESVQQEPVQQESVQQEPIQQESVQQEPIQQVPVQQTPVYQPPVQPAPVPKKSKALTPRKGGTIFGSVVLCLLVSVLVAALIALLGLRSVATQDGGAELVMQVFQSVDLTEIPAASLVADDDYDGSVADWIVEKAKAESNGKEQFDKRDFEKYLEESKMVKELSEHMGSLASDIREGTQGEELTAEDMRELLENDRKVIKEHLNFNITDKDIDKVISEMEKAKFLEYVNADALRDEAPSVFYAVQFGLSTGVLLLVAAVLLVLILFVCLVNRWRLLPISNDLGITLAVTGGLALCSVLAVTGIGESMFQSSNIMSLVGAAVTHIMGYYLMPSVIVLAVGVVLIVASVVGKILLKKKAAR